MLLFRLLIALLALWGMLAAFFVVYARRVWFPHRAARTVYPVGDAGSLLSPARRFLQPVDATLQRVRIEQGDTVLEIGPGPGYFSIEAARIVGPAGRVLCLDLQVEMAAILRGRLREAGARAVPLAGDATRLPLAGRAIDKAFLVAVLGEVPDRPAAIAELRRVIKPGGVLGFGETLTDPDYMFRDQLIDLCVACGLQFLDERPGLLGYTMTFRSPGA